MEQHLVGWLSKFRASVTGNPEKLLDWAFQALSRNDMASAASLYQQYADRVRDADPTLASFYENFISRAPESRTL